MVPYHSSWNKRSMVYYWYGMVWYGTSIGTILSPDPRKFSGIRGSFLEIINK